MVPEYPLVTGPVRFHRFEYTVTGLPSVHVVGFSVLDTIGAAEKYSMVPAS